MNLCKNNNMLFNIVSVIVQVIFVFSFLIIFYFLYVVNIEKDEFQKQIDILVNNLLKDYDGNLFNYNKNYGITDQDIKLISLGVLDIAQEKINLNSQKEIEQIIENNHKLKNKCYSIIGILIIILIILLFLLKCLPIYDILKESITVVFFIAITELIFLNFISGKYIAADPNRLKKSIGNSIKNWLIKNKKISNLTSSTKPVVY